LLISCEGEIVKDYKGSNKDFLWGAVAAILMLAPAMAVYILKTGGLS
jgi:hypothetical protein